MGDPAVRLIKIYVRDKEANPLPDAEIRLWVDGEEIGKIENSEGNGTIQLSPPDGRVEVEVRYKNFPIQREVIADDVDNFTFSFPARGRFTVGRNIIGIILSVAVVLGIVLVAFYLGAQGKVLPLALGVVLVATALTLAFAFKDANPLQQQLVRSTFAIGVGALASQVPGLLNINVTIGTTATISAAGAIAAFVVTFFFVPAGQPQP